MRKWWLRFTQILTILLVLYLVLSVFKPQWLGQVRTTLIDTPASTVQPKIASALVGLTENENAHKAIRIAAPAVVRIQTTVPHTDKYTLWSPLFENNADNTSITLSLGSGVIVDSKGHILTNNHVIENANLIEVQLADGRKAKAKIAGIDPQTDLAALKIDLPDLPAIALGNSDQLQVGDTVLAIGNLFGIGPTVSSGAVNALGHNTLGLSTFENFIQTSATINPGNSGGALVDLNGNLVGVNTAVFSRFDEFLDTGFAIPATLARQVLDHLLENGLVRRGYIGIEAENITPQLAKAFQLTNQQGIFVTSIAINGPAAKAQLQPSDVTISAAGQAVTNVYQLLNVVAAFTPGQSYSFVIKRQDKTVALDIVVGDRVQQM